MTYKDFTDIPVWQTDLEIGEDVFRLTANLPKSEDYGLTSQHRRASVSISANIAEGFGRSGSKDKAKFYDYLRDSAFQTNSLLLYGHKVGYFIESEIDLIINKSKSVIHDLNKVKLVLNKQLQSNGYVSEDFGYYGLNSLQSQTESQSQSKPQSQPQSQSKPQLQSQP